VWAVATRSSVEDQPSDRRGTQRCLHRADAAVGVAEQGDRPADRGDDGDDVLELTLDPVVARVAAGAAAAPVDREDREVGLEMW
jgi:hypothetical protein